MNSFLFGAQLAQQSTFGPQSKATSAKRLSTTSTFQLPPESCSGEPWVEPRLMSTVPE